MPVRKTAVAVAFLAACGGLLAVPSTTASADVTPLSCSHAWNNADPSSGRLVSGTDVRLRQAPHTNTCEIFGLIQPSHSVDFHCWARGDVANGTDTWTHLRVTSGPNAGKQGWVHDSLLVGFGSNFACGSGVTTTKPKP